MDGLPCREANDLTRTDMEAIYFAKSINFCLRSGDWASATEFVWSQFPHDAPLKRDERLATYRRGCELLMRYSCWLGPRLVEPCYVDGTPKDDATKGALAWFLIENGRICNMPAYRFVRFYPRKGAA